MQTQHTPVTLSPIGVFHTDVRYPGDAPRQATLARDATGTIQLLPRLGFEQALSDIQGFERIWLLFLFHHNNNWKPMTRPPRSPRKVGVFACRSPYRPNPVGISAVRLTGIKGLAVSVQEHDLLDGTPILDIKPYIPYADSFPQARTGWLDDLSTPPFDLAIPQRVAQQLAWLSTRGLPGLEQTIRHQLAENPTDGKRKRVTPNGEHWQLAYRTWRIDFTVSTDPPVITLLNIRSGYTRDELHAPEDPYDDKTTHRAFLSSSL